MKIKSLHIKNFKSIVDLTINEPNPFTVFVGPNGSGKSNIFEALEFFISENSFDYRMKLFGGKNDILNKNQSENEELWFNLVLDDFHWETSKYPFKFIVPDSSKILDWDLEESKIRDEEKKWGKIINSFSRVFVKNKEKQRINYSDDSKLTFSCDNLEKVLKRLLENKEKREEISEWLELFLPEFDRIEVQKSAFSRNEDLLIYQKHYKEPFNKELISDGTYNIIALLTAVYQSDEPQFLCIEEPENGLHPKVIKQLVNFFRNACEEKGHYIWLNTHSQTLVSVLDPKEIILVDKINGETQIKQFGHDFNLHGFEMDEAWLSNALGGGLPW
ncbi:MAG: AAA family ATPase [Emticicia sp.]